MFSGIFFLALKYAGTLTCFFKVLDCVFVKIYRQKNTRMLFVSACIHRCSLVNVCLGIHVCSKKKGAISASCIHIYTRICADTYRCVFINEDICMYRYRYVCIWMIKCVRDLLKFPFHSYIFTFECFLIPGQHRIYLCSYCSYASLWWL